MTIYELNNVLTNLAISNYLVNDAFVGDVYTINGKENKFACFVATPMSAVKDSTGLIRYNYILYYIDRLTKAEDNIDFVQSDAVNLLSGVLNYIEEQGIQVQPGYEFTLFRQKFSDWCAGAYVSVDIYVPYNDCNDSEFNLSGYGLTELIVDRNGIYVPEGFDGFDRVTINVPQVGATEEWVDNEIDTRLTGYATESWVSDHFGDVVKFNETSIPAGFESISKYIVIDSSSTYIGTSRTGLLFLGNEIDVYNNGSATVMATTAMVDATITHRLTSYSYASQSWVKTWVQSQGYLTSVPSSCATKNWVNNQGYLKVEDLNGLATEDWVQTLGYLTSIPSSYATKTWVNNQGFIKNENLDGLASQDWVENQGYINSEAIDDMATQTWTTQQGYITISALSGYATRSWINQQEFLVEEDLCDYATQDWVNQQGFLVEDDLCGYATETWVRSFVDAQDFVRQCDLEPYATKNWVENQGYLNQDTLNEALEPYATKNWVENQEYVTESWVSNNFIDNTEIQNYATIEYVTNNYVDNTVIQDYITTSDASDLIDLKLTGYATESWVQNQGYLTLTDISDIIWSGTYDDWEELTEEEQCSYLIAMIIE